jgi:hypothetical protein
MQELDLAYLAGLVDGEGHIGVRWVGASKGMWALSAGLGVYSSDLPVLLWCAEITGVGIVGLTHNQSPLSKKVQYRWRVTRLQHVLYILRLLWPYLKIKQDLADTVIEIVESYQGPQLQRGPDTVIQRRVLVQGRAAGSTI